MIALIISIILAAIFLVVMFATKDKPGTGIPISCLILSVTCLILGVLIFPAARAYESRFSLASEANRARTMVVVLGSADNYIKYLVVEAR